MITLIIFIFVLSVLVFVHEAGHFWMAKRSGMKVEEFGFGFPPRIWGVRKGGTVYSVNLIPFGGFVKILGEDGGGASDPRSFASAKPGAKAKVIVAGVVMNFFLAVILLILASMFGLRTSFPDEEAARAAEDKKIQIVQALDGSPAKAAGLRMFDEIVGFKVDNSETKVDKIIQIQEVIRANAGREIEFKIKRGHEVVLKTVVPEEASPDGGGVIGVSLVLTGVVKQPWHSAVIKGIESSAQLLVGTIIGYTQVIHNVFSTGGAGVELSGPVGIAIFTGQAARVGFSYLMQFVALLSINLVIINIFPFPALDGGRLLFIGIEKVKGKPVSRKVENLVNSVGFAFLILLMVYITVGDIFKFLI